MIIALVSSQSESRYKQGVVTYLLKKGYDIQFFDTTTVAENTDFNMLESAAKAVARRLCDRGLILSNSSQLDALIANKIQGVRCVIATDISTIQMSRERLDANILVLNHLEHSPEQNFELLELWLTTPYHAQIHQQTLQKVEEVERCGGDTRSNKTLLIRPEYLNQRGTLFGGYMMQWADDLAYSACSLAFPLANFVTRRVEAFDFASPVGNGDIVTLSAQVLGVGHSSCQVEVTCHDARTRHLVFRTQVVMVHVDEAGKKAQVPMDS